VKRDLTVPLHTAIFKAWADLLQSREALLLRVYLRSLGDLGVDSPLPITLEEARHRFGAAQGNPDPPISARDSLESKLVLGTRMIAAWVVLWTTLAPAALVAWFCVNRILSMPDRNWLSLGFVPIAFVILFPVFSVIGLFLQSIFIRPFNAFLDRLMVLPDDHSEHPPR
jgi:hypothetical protein